MRGNPMRRMYADLPLHLCEGNSVAKCRRRWRRACGFHGCPVAGGSAGSPVPEGRFREQCRPSLRATSRSWVRRAARERREYQRKRYVTSNQKQRLLFATAAEHQSLELRQLHVRFQNSLQVMEGTRLVLCWAAPRG